MMEESAFMMEEPPEEGLHNTAPDSEGFHVSEDIKTASPDSGLEQKTDASPSLLSLSGLTGEDVEDGELPESEGEAEKASPDSAVLLPTPTDSGLGHRMSDEDEGKISPETAKSPAPIQRLSFPVRPRVPPPPPEKAAAVASGPGRPSGDRLKPPPALTPLTGSSSRVIRLKKDVPPASDANAVPVSTQSRAIRLNDDQQSRGSVDRVAVSKPQSVHPEKSPPIRKSLAAESRPAKLTTETRSSTPPFKPPENILHRAQKTETPPTVISAEVPLSETKATNGDPRSCLPTPTLCPKPPPGTLQKGIVPVRTNIWKFYTSSKVLLYRYSVTITEKNSVRPKTLTKGAADDFHRQMKRTRCYDLFYHQVVKKNVAFFGDAYSIIYDRQTCLYTRKPLDVGLEKFFDAVMDKQEFSVRLAPSDQGPLDLNDFGSLLTPFLPDRDRSSIQAMELLTSQGIFSEGRFIVFGNSFYEEPKFTVDLGSGRYLMDGFQKSVRIIEGDSSPTAAVQIDLKKSAFYKPQPVLQTLKETLTQGPRPGPGQKRNFQQTQPREPDLSRPLSRLQLDVFARNIRDVVVKANPSGREFRVSRLSDRSAEEETFVFCDERRGKEERMTVARYFDKVHRIKLRYPHLPCLVELRPKKEPCLYPMELCEVAPYQRVPNKKQTEEERRNTVRATAVPPAKRQEEIRDKVERAGLWSSRQIDAFDARVSSRNLSVDARLLPQPSIQYASQRIAKPDQKGYWEQSQAKWAVSGVCGKWALFCFDQRCDPAVAEEFVDAFKAMCKTTGVMLGRLSREKSASPEAAPALFREAARSDIQFALCLVSDQKDKFLHDAIKLAERECEIQTQCVTVGIARQILHHPPQQRNKWQSVFEKIIGKTNMKLGGLNYQVQLSSSDPASGWLKRGVLLMGVDVNHPPPMSLEERKRGLSPREPSVVGCVANSRNEPFLFTGEYSFQDPRVEEVNCMEELTTEFLKRFCSDLSQKQLPETVFVFRDGVSEGQFQKVIQEEGGAMERAFRRVGGASYRPQLNQIVVLKRHTTRFFPKEMNPRAKPAEQNIPCGAVVDTTVVHPTQFEFFLCSHTAIQGTAKVPKYVVVRNDSGLSADEMQMVSYALAHGHQIIPQTVSLPAPVYGAHELASRGKRLFYAHSGKEESASGTSDGAMIAWDELNSRLCTSGTVFATRKHWA